MALPRLKAYYHGKKKQRLQYIFVEVDDETAFWVKVKRRGKRRTRKCGSLAAARYLAENIDKLFPEEEKKKKVMLLSELCELYRAEDQRKNASWKDHKRQEENLVRILGDLPIDQIRRGLIPWYQDKRLAEGVTNKTCNDDIKRLHRLFNQALRDEIVPFNPISGYERLPEPKGRERYLTEKEEELLRAEFDEEAWRVVQIALLSGMRRSEMFTCLREQVRWESKTIFLSHTKGGESRHVLMSDDLAEVVRAQLDIRTKDGDPLPWLIPNRSRTNVWMPRNFYRLFESARDRSGIPHIRFHDLRHTFATRLAMAGAHPKEIQLLLGQKDPKMTNRYSHYSDAHLRATVNLLNRSKN